MTWVCEYCNLKKECVIKRENGEIIDTKKCEEEFYECLSNEIDKKRGKQNGK